MCAQRRLRSASGIRQVCAQKVAKNTSFLPADSEDSDQTGLHLLQNACFRVRLASGRGHLWRIATLLVCFLFFFLFVFFVCVFFFFVVFFFE